MKTRTTLVVSVLCLVPALSLADSICNTTMEQDQAYGSLSLDCAIGFFEHDKQNNTRRACAELTVPGNKDTISEVTEPYSTEEMSDTALRDKACFDAAMKYAKMPQ